MRFYALIPAAGSGSRMGSVSPKQYLSLAGRPMIYHALRTFFSCAQIEKIYVVLAADDAIWAQYDWSQFAGKLETLYCGGVTRSQSVANGLAAMEAEGDDWVLVHDAARPCFDGEMLARLIDELHADEVGGLLALPVADTLKRADAAGRVLRTEARENLWAAQTPQMFRHALLRRALQASDFVPTDEASAVEALGLSPKLVTGDPKNFKVTYSQDLQLAQMILQERK